MLPASAKSNQISPGIFLESRDVIGSRGQVTAIEYSLSVQKDKLVIFDMDFSGSTNISLDRGSNGNLKRRTAIQPWSRAVVGVARVVDENKGWGLETRYSWREENPGALQPGSTKTEKLSEGLVLITSRLLGPPDGFVFEVQCSRNATITLLMDCSRCANLQLDSGGTSVSVVVPPFERILVATMHVVDQTKGYSMLTRWSWADGIASSTNMMTKDASPFGTRSPNQMPGVRPSPDGGSRAAPNAVPSLKQPKREEISPNVILITCVCFVDDGHFLLHSFSNACK